MKNKIKKYLLARLIDVLLFFLASHIIALFVFFAYGMLPETIKFFSFGFLDYVRIGFSIKVMQMAISLVVKMDKLFEEA